MKARLDRFRHCEQRSDVRYWHKADMAVALSDVRFWG
jgi:hypothetical protein